MLVNGLIRTIIGFSTLVISLVLLIININYYSKTCKYHSNVYGTCSMYRRFNGVTKSYSITPTICKSCEGSTENCTENYDHNCYSLQYIYESSSDNCGLLISQSPNISYIEIKALDYVFGESGKFIIKHGTNICLDKDSKLDDFTLAIERIVYSVVWFLIGSITFYLGIQKIRRYSNNIELMRLKIMNIQRDNNKSGKIIRYYILHLDGYISTTLGIKRINDSINFPLFNDNTLIPEIIDTEKGL